jgi:S1-C subfamily serine protease
MGNAGLKSGDVIVSVDGKRKIPYEHFRAYIPLEHDPGDKVELVYVRGGKEYEATLVWR